MPTIVADIHPYIVGVDTHARTHTYAIIAATGEHVVIDAFPNSGPGRARAIAWASRRIHDDQTALWAIEGAATYGAMLAHEVAKAGYTVVEVARMSARSRHGVGKLDPIDARRIAAAVLPLEIDQLRHLRNDDDIRAAIQTLLTAREQMTHERTRAVNALTALLRTNDLSIDARRHLPITTLATIARWRMRDEPLAAATAKAEAIRLAKRIDELDDEIQENYATMTSLVEHSPAAGLLTKPGIGTVSAATVLAVWSHPGRIRSEAAFASIAGVNPIPASSSNTVRYRLNRGGDRRLNRVLNTIAIVHMTHDAETRTYAAKRRAEGKTDREIKRLLKRYLARQIYKYLTTTSQNPNPA